uniref:Putative leucine rich repeat protein n=1 Tax=Toxoplasma gondii TgCATBr9 TaxID=943120 RepID=A0A2T6IVN2_TOXGO|nr:putative leucine rich repeat protein [Toxoplasma gondii TgCATBr9]
MVNPFLVAASQSPALRSALREREASRQRRGRKGTEETEERKGAKTKTTEAEEKEASRPSSPSGRKRSPSCVYGRDEARLRFLWQQLQTSSAGVVAAEAVTAAVVALARRSEELRREVNGEAESLYPRENATWNEDEVLPAGILAEAGDFDILQYTSLKFVCPFTFDLNLRGGTHLWTALHLAGRLLPVHLVLFNPSQVKEISGIQNCS